MRFEIWSEGYVVTGNSAGAHLHGTADGATFQEACATLLGGDPYFSSIHGTYYGYRLFDNEADARKEFG